MDRSRTYTLTLAIFCGVIFFGTSVFQPELKLVDFLSFCGRAQNLASHWIDPLYPPYYPTLLKTLHPLTKDALNSGRIISGLSAIWMLTLWSRQNIGYAVALVCSGALLQFGSVEGTDMAAAAFCLSGLALAKRKPLAAGIIIGIAFGFRYTAMAAIPSVLWLSSQRKQTIAALLLTSAPCWLPALILTQSPIDMSSNVRISNIFSALPINVMHALSLLAFAPLTYLGSFAFIQNRKKTLHGAIALYGLIHLVGCCIFFTNPRILLPVSLCFGLLAGSLYTHRWFLPFMVLIGGFAFYQQHNPHQSPPIEITKHLSEQNSCFVSNTPWAYKKRADGWLEPGLAIQELHQRPTWSRLSAWTLENNCHHIVLDQRYPLPKQIPNNLLFVKAIGQWRVYGL